MKKNTFLKVTILSISLLCIPGCFLKKWITKSENSSSGASLVTADKGIVIATQEDFKKILALMEKSDSGMQLLPLLPESEQERVYIKLINDYLVSNYIIKRHLDEEGINKTKEFQDEYNEYMKIVEGSFYASTFQKRIADSIVISDTEAREFYEIKKSSLQEFMTPPFCKKSPGIEARAIKMDEGKDIKEYEGKLKANKDVIKLERINRSIRGTSGRLVDELESMKDAETRIVTLENGLTFAVYRVKNHEGEWNEYDAFADQIKNVIKMQMIDKKYNETVENLRTKYNININEVQVKNIIQKQQKSEEELDKVAEKAAEVIENEIAAEEAIEEIEKENTEA
jgi:hypothetical protein